MNLEMLHVTGTEVSQGLTPGNFMELLYWVRGQKYETFHEHGDQMEEEKEKKEEEDVVQGIATEEVGGGEGERRGGRRGGR